jgi:hypothetical protein
MGLIEKLRNAEEQGRQAARNAFERAKELGEDAERRIRQKMRIYPPCADNNVPADSSRAARAGAQSGGSSAKESEVVPIVTIRGEDVKTDKVA